MSDFIYYAQSIDDASLTYSATENSGYDIDNIKNRDINSFFKDTGVGVASVNIIIDLGSARSCDYILLGNYLATGSTDVKLSLECNSSDSWGSPTNAFLGSSINATSLTNYVKTFSTQNFRYWRLVIYAIAGTITNLQFGTIFLGTRWEHNHNPEIGVGENSGYKAGINESISGTRCSLLTTSTIRKQWNYDYKYITETEKTKFETWRDNIYIGEGLSHYPFYFSDDGGTTLYFVRNIGKLNLKEHAYQAYETSITLDEEL